MGSVGGCQDDGQQSEIDTGGKEGGREGGALTDC